MNKNHPRSGDAYNRILSLTNEAIQVWNHNANIKIQRGYPEDADILIDFARLDHGDGFHFTGKSGTLAHAFPPSSGLGGDVHMDQDEDWDIEDGKKGDVSYFFTLLHEVNFNFLCLTNLMNLNYQNPVKFKSINIHSLVTLLVYLTPTQLKVSCTLGMTATEFGIVNAKLFMKMMFMEFLNFTE